MSSRRKRHPNYKAYLNNQLRILQVKFPFLSSKQIKAKICSSWERFSPEKKNDWGTPLSPMGRKNNGKANCSFTSNNGSEASSYESQADENSEYYKKSADNSCSKRSMKKVRFVEPTNSMEDDSPVHSPIENSDSTPEIWPLFNDFNTIMAHRLDVEEGVSEEMPEEDTDMYKQQSTLFGDLNSILDHKLDENKYDENIDEESDSEAGALMCNLFEDIKPGLHSANHRLLTCFDDTSEESKRVAGLFQEDDHEFFA